MHTRPSHISFPQSPSQPPLLSPPLTFYTAPSTPISSPKLDLPPPPPSELVVHVPPPPARPSSPLQDPPSHDEAFPIIDQLPVDPFLDDEGLTSLEKIYLFSRSQATFHRVFIIHALPSLLDQISPLEAVEYVLPLLSGLVMDPDEQVKEALAAELVPIIWWFFSHCQIVEDDASQDSSSQFNNVTCISVQAFTPILGTLLLSPNGLVGGPARYAVVEVLSRMRKADEREERMRDGNEDRIPEGQDDEYAHGLFGHIERKIFQDEILQQVVIGMGRLHPSEEVQGALERQCGGGGDEAEEDQQAPDTVNTGESKPQLEDIVNPYFPTLSSDWATPSATPESQAVASTFAPTTNTPTIPPTTTLAEVRASDANTNTSLCVSFAHLPVVPSFVDKNQPDGQVLFSPDGVLPTHRPTSSDPLIVKQEWETRSDNEYYNDAYGLDHDELDEQAAVGRLSSMSLMAAVTAGGPLEEETKTAFVKEVERIGRDKFYWVRREASFALGALAKIVPEEVVVSSLLPVFESLRGDSVWHVRHSALFALPAILSRLTPKQRRTLAIDTVIPLSVDESASVRLGLLEALGEVLYTFHEDEDGPPEELLRLFLGRTEDFRAREERQPSPPLLVKQFVKQQIWGIPKSPFTSQMQNIDTMASAGQVQSPLESFYRDPARPLICAFNYPAVALSLGRSRWGEIRELYVVLSQDAAVKVRRTLAASLGELAKIIGPDNTQQDLLPVWWDGIKCEEDGEVRLKAIECVGALVDVLGERKVEVAERLLDVWKAGILKGWRERQVAARAIVAFIRSIDKHKPSVIKSLLKVALEDRVAGVREAAISTIPQVWKAFEHRQDVLDELHTDIRSFAQSPWFRNRMTFISCQEALVMPGVDGKSLMVMDDGFWTDLDILASDKITGVRISLARFTGLLRALFLYSVAPLGLRNLVSRLAVDLSQEVRSFVLGDQSAQHNSSSTHANKRFSKRISSVSTFSRPPP